MVSRSQLLQALEFAKRTFPESWNNKTYMATKKAIKVGELMRKSSVIGLGTPFIDDDVAEVYLFRTNFNDINLLVQIGKKYSNTAKIGASIFRIRREGNKWRVLEG